MVRFVIPPALPLALAGVGQCLGPGGASLWFEQVYLWLEESVVALARQGALQDRGSWHSYLFVLHMLEPG